MRTCWDELQGEVGKCTRCKPQLPDVSVNAPPGLLYPAGVRPPDPLRVLFIGVAPPENGRHFYTDPADRLGRGLFKVMTELGRSCGDISTFVASGFFLVHTAKCAIRGTTSPDLKVSKFCASLYLRREIECLEPDGLCFLSKNIGLPISRALSAQWGFTGGVEFGKPIHVALGQKLVHLVATAWPGRGHEHLTKVHLQALFRRLGMTA